LSRFISLFFCLRSVTKSSQSDANFECMASYASCVSERITAYSCVHHAAVPRPLLILQPIETLACV
jgi:hypothetical protein